jgi:hypothetical protein
MYLVRGRTLWTPAWSGRAERDRAGPSRGPFLSLVVPTRPLTLRSLFLVPSPCAAQVGIIRPHSPVRQRCRRDTTRRGPGPGPGRLLGRPTRIRSRRRAHPNPACEVWAVLIRGGWRGGTRWRSRTWARSTGARPARWPAVRPAWPTKSRGVVEGRGAGRTGCDGASPQDTPRSGRVRFGCGAAAARRCKQRPAGSATHEARRCCGAVAARTGDGWRRGDVNRRATLVVTGGQRQADG